MRSGDFKYEVLPQGIRIQEYAGEDTEVEIPAEIEGIPVRILGSHAFYENDMTVRRIVIPDSVRVIEPYACEFCLSLEELVLPNGVEELGQGFMVVLQREELYIPPSVKKIEHPTEIGARLRIDEKNPYYFSDGCGLYKNLPNGGYSLEMFDGSRGIQSYAVLPGTVHIAADSFETRGSLKCLHLPASLRTTDDGAMFDTIHGFTDDEDIDTITVDPDNPVFFTDRTGLYHRDGDGVALLRYFQDYGDVELPEEVYAIGRRAFSGREIRRIEITDRIKHISEGAFYDCVLREADFVDRGMRIYFPADRRFLLKTVLQGFGSRGQRFDFSYYDHAMKEEPWHRDRIRMICCRLICPIGMTHSQQELFRTILYEGTRRIYELLTEKEDMTAMEQLAQLGFFEGERIEEAIAAFNASDCRESLAFLMEYKREHGGFTETDFSL